MVAVLAMLLAVQQSEVTLTSLKILAPEGRATDGRSLKNGQVGDVGTEDKGSLGSTEGYKDLADVAGGAEYFDEVEGYEGYDSEGERESYEGISSMQDMFLLKEGGKVKYTVSYPPAKYRFHKHMLNKTLCDRYTLECIDVSPFVFDGFFKIIIPNCSFSSCSGPISKYRFQKRMLNKTLCEEYPRQMLLPLTAHATLKDGSSWSCKNTTHPWICICALWLANKQIYKLVV